MKKKLKYVLFLFFLSTTFISCELIIDKDTTDKVSQESVYPRFEVEGEFATLKQGAQYNEGTVNVSEVKAGETDLNSTLTVKIQKVHTITSGANSAAAHIRVGPFIHKGFMVTTIDTLSTGFYFFTYQAINKFNYIDSAFRSVYVYDDEVLQNDANIDLSGNYKKGDKFTMKVTKDADKGTWSTTNIDASETAIPCKFVDIKNGKYIIVPGKTNTVSYYGIIEKKGTKLEAKISVTSLKTGISKPLPTVTWTKN